MEGSIIAFSVIFLIIAMAGRQILNVLEDVLNEMEEKRSWVPKRYTHLAYIAGGLIITSTFGWLWCLFLIIFRAKYVF